MQVLVPLHAHLVLQARHLRSARPLAQHVPQDLTQVPSRVAVPYAPLAITLVWVPLVRLVYLVLFLILDRLFARRVLLDHTQDPSPVAVPYAPLAITQLWVCRHAHLVNLVLTLSCLDRRPVPHVPVANSLALAHSPAPCALPDS